VQRPGLQPEPCWRSRRERRTDCRCRRSRSECPENDTPRYCMAAEETWRLLSCARCGRQLRVCSSCELGQRYCGRGCAQEQRRLAQRDASRAYQATRRGRRLHADRMQRWRDRGRQARRKLSAPKVTQHSETQGVAGARSESAVPTLVGLPAGSEEGPAHAPILAVHAARDAAPNKASSSRAGGRLTQGASGLASVSPAGATNIAGGSESLERRSAAGCSFCGRALPRFASIDALRRRAVAGRKPSRAIRHRAPRPPTGPPLRSR
jgi:hypothetical protein